MTIQQQMSAADEFTELWKALMPEPEIPDRQQFLLWSGTYNSELVSRGINRAAAKARKMKNTETPMSAGDTIRYASSVMKNELLGRKAHF